MHTLPVMRSVSSGDLTYRMVTVVDISVFLKCIKKIDLKCSHHTHERGGVTL